MNEYIDVGEIVRITTGEGFKTKPAGTLFDPTVVELTVRTPSGTVTDESVNVVNDSTGIYHADVTVDEAGWWWFHWDGDSVIEEGTFHVRAPVVGEVTS